MDLFDMCAPSEDQSAATGTKTISAAPPDLYEDLRGGQSEDLRGGQSEDQGGGFSNENGNENNSQVDTPGEGGPQNFSASPAPDMPRAPNENFNHFQNSQKINDQLTPIARKVSRFNVTDENKPRDLSEWIAHPRWADRKSLPGARGFEKNRDTILAVFDATNNERPDVPQDLREQQLKLNKTGDEMLIGHLIEFVATGGTVNEFARKSGIAIGKIESALKRNPEMAEKMYETKRTIGADAMAEEALRIASNPIVTEQVIETYEVDKDGNERIISRNVKRGDDTYARKLAFEARMKLLQKWAPDRYGDNVKSEIKSSMAEQLAKARARLRKARPPRVEIPIG